MIPTIRGAITAVLLLAACWLALACPASAAVTPAWKLAPVVPRIDGAVKKRVIFIAARGKDRGMRAGVFAKVGDSNTEMSSILYGFGCSTAKFGPRAGALAKVVKRFNRVRLANPLGFPGCQPSTSFSRRSAAAKSGSWTAWPATRVPGVDEYYQPPEYCREHETPLICELRIIRPRYAFIMAGTNDIFLDRYLGGIPGAETGKRLLLSVSQARARGVIPVLSTIPPMISARPDLQFVADNGVARANAHIFRLARAQRLPMINLWRALTAPRMVNGGLSNDGLHLGVFAMGDWYPTLDGGPVVRERSVDLRPGALRFGANRRNLIIVMTLARLDRITN